MSVLTNSINANATTPLAVGQGGTGANTLTAHGVLLGEGSGAVTSLVLAAGQLAIGTTAGDPSAAALTAGTGISISSVSGSITITNTQTSSTMWSAVTVDTALVAGHGYINNGSSVALNFTLPATAAIGDTFQVLNATPGTQEFVIKQNASQSIQLGNETTTAGTGGSITSVSTSGDWIEIVCVVTNTGYAASMRQGQASVA